MLNFHHDLIDSISGESSLDCHYPLHFLSMLSGRKNYMAYVSVCFLLCLGGSDIINVLLPDSLVRDYELRFRGSVLLDSCYPW